MSAVVPLPDPTAIDLARAEALLPGYVTTAPRYTSYPTVPVWSESYGPEAFQEDLARAGGAPDEGLSLYVHVPFCRSLCHFCACNRVVTRDPERPARYLDTIEREIATLRSAMPRAPAASQLHWGGGTPTHLAPDAVRRLFRAVTDAFPLAPGAEVSIEVDPRVTTQAHVEALRECGFDRISLGVQDFDPRVQAAIHRLQPAEQTARLVDAARRAGFASVNLDLIYGLPFQTLASFTNTLDTVVALAPDRLAVYGYAHVTWVAKQQRGFERQDLPDPAARLRLQLLALRRLVEAGWVPIGMDHFARREDELTRALGAGTLRRNFMGYTTQAGVELLGFGPSAISELRTGYAQSQRDLGTWQREAGAGRLATWRGHRLSAEDRARGWIIARLLCHGAVDAAEYRRRFGATLRERHAPELARLAPLEADGLVLCEPDGGFQVTPLGRLLLRNVAALFDAYLPEQQRSGAARFSRTV